ncbi:MAG: M28 family peptidase [Flammeovirgaceae bacterium]
MIVDQERLFKDVLWLTSVIPSRNFWNIEVLAEVADELYHRFQTLGLASTKQVFEADEQTFSNIFATIGPQDAERIIIAAHYDVCGEIAGADVNASGVAGILELARLLKQSAITFNYQIEFALYGLTEAPYFGTDLMGSLHHLQQLKAAQVSVHSMLALSGIGYFSDEPNSQEYPMPALTVKHPAVGNFIGISCLKEQSDWFNQVSVGIQAHTLLPVELIVYPVNNDNLGIADHRCFLRKGYRAAMIGNGGVNRNPNYHQIPDTIETLDFTRMAEVVSGLFGFLADIQG